MTIFRFNITYSAHTFVEVRAIDLESAKEDVQAELEFQTLGTIDSYHIDSVKEVDDAT